MSTTIPTQLRENIWDGRFHADRLSRYYGEMAGKRARSAARLMMLGCAIAFVGPYLGALGFAGSGWLSTLVALAGAAVAFRTMVAGQKGSVDAMMRHYQLSILHNEWTDLWEQIEDDTTDFVNRAEVRARWRELTRRIDDITASTVQDKVDEVVLQDTYQATRQYYSEENTSVPVTT